MLFSSYANAESYRLSRKKQKKYFMNSEHYTVAVITSTIAKPELEQAILSVRAQTHPCRHYVFVDGKQYAGKVKLIEEKYPDVIFTYLPMNTGAGGWLNSSINAVAPFLVKEDIICYLDDDNWYEPDHVESCIKAFDREETQYVWTMRNFVSIHDGKFICRDFFDSLGHFQRRVKQPIKIRINNNEDTVINLTIPHVPHVDTNCYAIKRDSALKVAQAWNSGFFNDKNVFNELKRIELMYREAERPFHCRCTDRFTVNYRVNMNKFMPDIINFFRKNDFTEEDCRLAFEKVISAISESNKAQYGNKFPWE